MNAKLKNVAAARAAAGRSGAETASAEQRRLDECTGTVAVWKAWGPYLSERQWGTVREDYSTHGNAWDYFPHDHARSRAYRWGEDGIAGVSDAEQRLCLALALWNGRDPILKERLFGLTNGEGNHGEDVKELYYYLDATPSHSYLKMLYKYPQGEFPYARLVDENKVRMSLDEYLAESVASALAWRLHRCESWADLLALRAELEAGPVRGKS